jgi:multicomponent K+:H+ antiporter subunit E
MPRYLLRVIRDIVTASFQVAALILSGRRPRPRFVCYPLELEHPLAISILASTISLTPGTVSADVSDDQRTLLIHALDADSDQQVIDTIRERYEQPLLEMFPC